MTARIYNSPCAEVLANQAVRAAAINYLKEHMYDLAPNWKRSLSPASLTLTSPCGAKIIKVDSTKICTVDTRTSDGGWKTLRFTSKTIEEAWRVAVQTIKAFDAARNRNVLH